MVDFGVDEDDSPRTTISQSSDISKVGGVVVHHLRQSQSERIVWLCEELKDVVPEFDYNLVIYDRDSQTARAPSDLAKIHPVGTAPMLVDESRSPRQIIAESQAIVDWLIQMHGNGQHFTVMPWQPEYGEYLFWYSFANGSLQANMTKLGTIDMLIKSFNKSQKAKDRQLDTLDALQDLNQVFGMFKERLEDQFNLIDARLEVVKYLAGENFTVADVMTVYSLTSMRGFYPMDLTERKNILRYLQDIVQRPAYVRAMQRAEPGMKPMVEVNVQTFDFAVFKE